LKINISNNNNDEFKSDFDEKENEIINFDEKISGKEIASFDFNNYIGESAVISNDYNLQKNNIRNDNSYNECSCDEILNYSGDKTQSLKSSSRLIPLSRIHKNNFLNSSGLTRNSNGASHIIDGEAPDSKRCYNLRSSTVRKISELKSIHPDINICVSTIVDSAVAYYYSCIMEEWFQVIFQRYNITIVL